MTTLYLIRHGETVNNVAGCYNGMRDDHPLNEAGSAQAKRLAAAFAEIPIDAIYTSTLLRARQTGDILRGDRGISVTAHPGLMEFDFGILSSMPYGEAAERYPALVSGLRMTPYETKCPEGESGRDVIERGTAALAEIVRACRGKTVAVVTHGMLLQLVFSALAGLPPYRRRELSVFNTAHARLEIRDDGTFRICSFNCHDHFCAEDREKAARKYRIYPETVDILLSGQHYFEKFAVIPRNGI
jgi:broad specificity phosphatase PhoE